MAFGSLLTTLGLAALKGEVKATARRAGRKAAFGAATAFLILIAFGFGLAALTVWLAANLGVIEALLIVAAGALVLAVIVQVVASSMDGRRALARRPVMTPIGDTFRDPRRETYAAAPADEPPAGSVAGSMGVVALVGFILAKTLFRRR
jgi:hypothetical protein